jgi:Tol biopolymer transport system component
MARRTILLQTAIVAAVLVVACAAVLLAVPKMAEAAFPGANGRIVYSADVCCSAGGVDQIFTIKPDGTGVKQLTHSKDVYNFAPVFSPDGKKIAWARNGDGDVWVMNADGTNKERLTSGTAEDFDPAFSPNGRRVVFGRYDPQEGRSDIYIKALDSGDLRRITNDQARESGPVFRPGGGRIAFSRSAANPACNVCGSLAELATVRRDGTGLRVITDIGAGNGAEPRTPNWSPDGRTLVYGLYDFNTEVGHLETINPDGTGRRTVFASNSPLSASAPVFSPDGTKIAFQYEDGWDIWTINTDGSRLSDVTNTPNYVDGQEVTPDWQPKLQPTG